MEEGSHVQNNAETEKQLSEEQRRQLIELERYVNIFSCLPDRTVLNKT